MNNKIIDLNNHFAIALAILSLLITFNCSASDSTPESIINLTWSGLIPPSTRTSQGWEIVDTTNTAIDEKSSSLTIYRDPTTNVLSVIGTPISLIAKSKTNDTIGHTLNVWLTNVNVAGLSAPGAPIVNFNIMNEAVNSEQLGQNNAIEIDATDKVSVDIPVKFTMSIPSDKYNEDSDDLLVVSATIMVSTSI